MFEQSKLSKALQIYSFYSQLPTIIIFNIMSINNIRQRKLFKKKDQLLNRLLTDASHSEDQKQYQCKFKTQVSEHRDSYSSRPTLQSNHILKQLFFLENKIIKHQSTTRKCFQQMQSLEQHYQATLCRQKQQYYQKKQQILNRLTKQQQRNIKAEQRNLELLQRIVHSLINKRSNHQNIQNILTDQKQKKCGGKKITMKIQNKSEVFEVNKKQLATQFLQGIKCELMYRKMKGLKNSVQPNQTPIRISPIIQQTFDLGIKSQKFQQRESQSILLDNSFII